MKRCLLFCYLLFSSIVAMQAADVTYIFSDAAVAAGIAQDSSWTTDVIDEYSYWETKKATFGHSKWNGNGLLIYKNGKFNLYSSRMMSKVTLIFDNESIEKKLNDTTFTWIAEKMGTLSKLEIMYQAEERDTVADTPTN